MDHEILPGLKVIEVEDFVDEEKQQQQKKKRQEKKQKREAAKDKEEEEEEDEEDEDEEEEVSVNGFRIRFTFGANPHIKEGSYQKEFRLLPRSGDVLMSTVDRKSLPFVKGTSFAEANEDSFFVNWFLSDRDDGIQDAAFAIRQDIYPNPLNGFVEALMGGGASDDDDDDDEGMVKAFLGGEEDDEDDDEDEDAPELVDA